MTQVLLCGEGSHEIGESQVWSKNRGDFEKTEGWMHVVARKLLGEEIEFLTRSRRELLLLPRQERKHRPLPEGHGAKALIAKLVAGSTGCDVVVFMADADTADTAGWRAKRAQILDGFDRIENRVRGVACVPKSASESWLLADGEAWRTVGLQDLAVLPARPETIWGNRDDPNGRHPHQWFARVCSSAGVPDSRPTRVDVAQASNPCTLRANCPVSFVPFSEDMVRAANDE